MQKNILDLIEYSQGGIVSKEIYKTDKNNVTLMCMSAGSEMSEHTSTREGIIYVLEGDGIFTLEGEAIAMKAGVSILMKENAIHSLRALENTSFILVLN